MENNLTEISNHKRTVIELLTKTLTPSQLQSHGSQVELRLEIVSRKYDRFGWDQISKEVRTILKADWTASLLNYSTDEIDAAIRKYVDDVKNRKAPHEGQVKAIIIANRQRAVAAQPKAQEPDTPPADVITAERRQEIMAEVGFRGSIGAKSFNAKLEVKE